MAKWCMNEWGDWEVEATWDECKGGTRFLITVYEEDGSFRTVEIGAWRTDQWDREEDILRPILDKDGYRVAHGSLRLHEPQPLVNTTHGLF